MRLPHADRAEIDAAKLKDYLLSTSHPLGRFKAAFFLSLGYEAEHWQRLAADLREQHLALEVTPVPAAPHGTKFVIRGSLRGPSGRDVQLVSVWILPEGADAPRFVTAYPGDA